MTDPSGVPWRVGRRWLAPAPRRADQQGRYDATGNAVPTDAELALFSFSPDALTATPSSLWFFVILSPIIALLIAIPFLVVYVVAGVVAVTGVLLGLAAALLLHARRRTWIVQARAPDHGHAWRIRGWQSSRVAMDVLAEKLRAGAPLPPGSQRLGTPREELPELWRDG